MTEAQHIALTTFLDALRSIPWFDHCGDPDPTAIVTKDLAEAWDGWNYEMVDVWSPQSHALEKVAIAEIGDSGVDTIFATVCQAMEEPLCAGLDRYVNRWPRDNMGLTIELKWFVMRDLSWAAVETVLGRPGFFTDLLSYYRAGRWACAWEGGNRSSRVVLL